METNIRLPAIFSDIDGVIYSGFNNILGNAKNVIKSLKQPYSNKPVSIPFMLLTNGGGFIEAERIKKMNKLLGLDEEPEQYQLTPDQITQCHTPLSAPEFINEFGDKYVLISGYFDVINVALLYGLKKCVLLEEMAALYPEAVPGDLHSLPLDKRNELKAQLMKRLSMNEDELKQELKFAAIILFNGVIDKGIGLQIFADIIASKDGHILGERRNPKDPQQVKLIVTNADLVYQFNWPVPRWGPMALILSLEVVMKQFYGLDLETIQYGKPWEKTFEFAKQILIRKAGEQGVNVSNYYMIGDNPESDIRGANRMGWTSILVTSGVFKQGTQPAYTPSYIVSDFQEAVKLIFRLEGLQINID